MISIFKTRRISPYLPVLVFLLGLYYFYQLQFSSPYIGDVDGYYHIKYSYLTRINGIMSEFPWWQRSIHTQHFADKEFLFHIALIPFTYGDLIYGAKLSAVLFAAGLLAVFCWILQANQVRFPLLWTSLLLAAGPLFLYRLSLPRPHLAAMILSLLGTHWVLNGRYYKAGILSGVYALTYTASHTLLILAMIDDLNRSIQERKIGLRATLWVSLGLLAGFLLHPNFPHNLRIWYSQNILLLAYLWRGIPPLNFGGELYPMSTKLFLSDSIAVILPYLLGCYLSMVSPKPIRRETSSLFLFSAAFLLITWMSKRFVEYWVPFTVLFCGFVLTDALGDVKAHLESRRQRFIASLVGLICCIAIMGQAYRNYHLGVKEMKEINAPHYQGGAQWLERNTPPGATIYTTDWDDFPELFFYNSSNRYLVGLDPIFMYLFDKELYSQWNRINTGKITRDPYDLFLKKFNTAYLLTDYSHGEFIRMVENHPLIKLAYQDSTCRIYMLLRKDR